MKTFVGLDVSQKKTAVCVVDEQGKKTHQFTVDTNPKAIVEHLRSIGQLNAKVGMETGLLSVWLFHSLKELSVDIDCIHARHVHAALSMQLNETDQNDAYGIARLVQSGWYRPTHVKSLDCHQIRLLLTAREKLIQIKVTLTNQIRGLLKTFGVVLSPGRNSVFEQNVIESVPTIATVKPIVLMLMQTQKDVVKQIRAMDKQLAKYASDDPVCKLLKTIPGVGTLTAVSYKTSIDDPSRFTSVADVGAFLGLPGLQSLD